MAQAEPEKTRVYALHDLIPARFEPLVILGAGLLGLAWSGGAS